MAVFHHPKLKISPNSVKHSYIIEFHSKSSSKGSIAKRDIINSLRHRLKRSDFVKRDFDHELFNGMTIDLKSVGDEKKMTETLNYLVNHNEVKKIHSVRKISRPKAIQKRTTTTTVEAFNASAMLPHTMTQVDKVHSELNFTGQGILIGVIDSGVDYKHPALGGGFGPGYKISVGYDLVGDNYNADDEYPLIQTAKTPYDDCPASSGTTSGHGTHVSGIIIGEYEDMGFVGVAPNANLGMWRVFGCNGTTSNDIIIEAMLKAVDAGCDILSLSLDGESSWAETPEVLVAQNIVEKGIPVIVAAGNDAADGAFSILDPSSAKTVMSVASVDNANMISNVLRLDGSYNGSIEFNFAVTAVNDFPTGQIVAGTKNIGSGKEACSASDVPSNVKGKIAIVQRGTCTFEKKYDSVMNAGATGMIVYDDQDQEPTVLVNTETQNVTLVSISMVDGTNIVQALQKAPVYLAQMMINAIVPVDTANTISYFSSVGSTNEIELKPNVAGVGGYIFSTLPRNLGSWGVMSGTSMSTPYLAGAISLYMNSNNKSATLSTPQHIMEIFQNHALQVTVNNQNQKPMINNPVYQGAGLLQVYDTVKATVHISPSQISFNDTSSGNSQYKTQTINVMNHGTDPITLNVSHEAGVTLLPFGAYPTETLYSLSRPLTQGVPQVATLNFSSEQLSIPAGGNVNLTITVTPPSTDPSLHAMYGGYIHLQLQGDNNTTPTSVPYFGIAGDLTNLPIFTEGLPLLGNAKTGKPYGLNKVAFLNPKLKQNKEVAIFTQFNSPSAQVIVDIVDPKTNSTLGLMMPNTYYMDRTAYYNGTGDLEEYIVAKWDGTYLPESGNSNQTATVPDGNYNLRMRALKWNSPQDGSGEYETWISPVINVSS